MKLTSYQAYHLNHPEDTNRPVYKTVAQIAEETGLKQQLLKKRILKLSIKGANFGPGSTKHYTEDQARRLINYIKPPKRTGSVRITIVELHQTGMNIIEIAKNVKVGTILACNCVREYNTTGYITAESKLNYDNE